MKTIKEKAKIFKPKAANVAHRIPQGIRGAAELGRSQERKSENGYDKSTPENQAVDSVQSLTYRVAENLFHPQSRSAPHPVSLKISPFKRFSRSVSNKTMKAPKVIGNVVLKSFRSVVAAIKGISTTIAAVGWIAVTLIIVLALIGWVLMTHAGILAGGIDEDDPSRSIHTVLDELVVEVDHKIEAIVEENGEGCDISIQYKNGKDDFETQVRSMVIAAYAVKVSTDPNTPDQVVTLDARKETILRDIFWRVIQFKFAKTYDRSMDGSGTENSICFLNIQIEYLSSNELFRVLSFSESQMMMYYGLQRP